MSKPTLPNGYLGAQPSFAEYGLSTSSHAQPEIQTASEKVEIKFKTTKPTKVTVNLIEALPSGEDGKEFRELIFTQTQNDLISVIVMMPSAGYFKLQVYALPLANDSKELNNVFNYLINSTRDPRKAPTAFPKQFAQWKNGCFLIEPFNLSGREVGDSANFRVLVPGAKAVAVTAEGEWSHLTQKADGTWEGKVKGLNALKGKKASLNANFSEADGSKYQSLLEYSM